MGLRIRTNVASLSGQRALAESTKETNKSMARLSSGFRINQAADDAAGLSISETFKAKIRSMNQAKRNASDGNSMIQVAEGGMNEVSNILIRLRELAIQSSSDTIGNTERSFANREYQQLVSEVDRISNTTEFNGWKLLGGAENNDDKEQAVFHIGPNDGSIANTDTISLNIDKIQLNTSEDSLNLGVESEIGPVDPEGGFDREIAANKISVLDVALKRVAGNRAELGALQNRLNSTISNLSISIENAESANSRIRDVDFAKESANFTQQKILGQAGVSILSHANVQPEMALALLR